MLMLPLLPLLTLCKPAAAAGLPPVADCASLADANLGPNVTVLSAAEVDGAWAAGGSQQQAGQAAAGGGTCTFVDGVDVGEPSTVVTSFKGAGWVDQDKCCTACYANPKCGVAIVLDSSHKGLAGCWLKTGGALTAGGACATGGKLNCNSGTVAGVRSGGGGPGEVRRATRRRRSWRGAASRRTS